VPTLTELVDEEPEAVPDPEPVTEPMPEAEVSLAPEAMEPIAEIQDTPAQADTWSQELQVRMGRLNDDIHTLNVRLDRLEERIKTKV
jgi:hypothetical protein